MKKLPPGKNAICIDQITGMEHDTIPGAILFSREPFSLDDRTEV
jgi:hypothetical protein